MLIIDWIFLGLILIFVLLGLIFGFGKGLKFFTKGIIGFIISVIICYTFGGLIMQIGFVADLLAKFRGVFEGKEAWYLKLLLTIRIDIIVYYVALFIIIQILRIIIVKIIEKVMKSKNTAIQVINRIGGVILFSVMLVFLVMIVFQIIYLIGGETAANFTAQIAGSKIKIDWFYEHNPLIKIVEVLFKAIVIKKEEIITGAIMQFLPV